MIIDAPSPPMHDHDVLLGYPLPPQLIARYLNSPLDYQTKNNFLMVLKMGAFLSGINREVLIIRGIEADIIKAKDANPEYLDYFHPTLSWKK